MDSQTLWYIIVALIGVIAGGAGAGIGTLVRQIAKNPGVVDSSTDFAAAVNANAATAIAISNHLASVDKTLVTQGETLTRIELEQTRMSAAFKQFPETCKLRHENVDENMTRMQGELNFLRK